jgi:hypothetical protein
MKSRVAHASGSGMAALLCLVILVATLLQRDAILEIMLAAKWYVLAICLMATLVRLCIPRGGTWVSLACGAIVATSAFFAILFYATAQI